MSYFIYLVVKIGYGSLYPAYYSYKAVKNKDVKEYVHWTTYWIVLASWTLLEEIADVFLSFFFPFYYLLKTAFIIWLVSPTTRGSSLVYRKLVHPCLTKKEDDIDVLAENWKRQGLELGMRYSRAAAQKI